MFGGILSNGILTNELWLFNTTSERWSLRNIKNSEIIEGVAAHTATLIQNKLMVIGGISCTYFIISQSIVCRILAYEVT